MKIFVLKPDGKTVTVDVESNEKICSVKRKLEDNEGMYNDFHLALTSCGVLLVDEHTLADYNHFENSSLYLKPKTSHICVNILAGKIITLTKAGLNTIDDIKAKIYEQEEIPPDMQRLVFSGGELNDGNETLSENCIEGGSIIHLVLRLRGKTLNHECQQSVTSQPQTKVRKLPASVVASKQTKIVRSAKQTTPTKAAQNRHSIIGTNNEEVCAEYIQGLATCADREAMSHNNYDANLKFFALHQAKATAALSNLIPEFQSRPSSSVLTELEDLKRELATSRCKEKELEVTISGLTHKNKAFSSWCASYESQLVALEVENKKIKEELMVVDKKYLGARAAGFADGLKEGKAKWLTSVECLHQLTEASIQYFNYGFDSCQKQAEEQGFVGQLNKDSALKDAPKLKGWDSSALPE